MKINKITDTSYIFWLQKCLFPLFILVFGAISIWSDIALQTPYGQHQWRQCDAFSMALNYYHEEAVFFEPRMHFQHGNDAGSGLAVGEFTGTYWLNAQIWSVTGLKPYLMRWTHMVFWLLGSLALFALGRGWFGAWKAAFVTMFVSASPLIAFYAGSYLVNVAALGSVFVSWWLAWQLLQTERVKTEWRWILELLLFLFLSLAVLFRPTMALGWLPIAIWALRRGNLMHWAVRFALPLTLGVGWVLWAKSVNDVNGSVYFCTTIRPLWGAEHPEIIWRAFRENLLPEWYHRYVLIVLGFSAVLLGFNRLYSTNSGAQVQKRVHSNFELKSSVLLLALGLTVYFLLWFENLDVHDYYLIEFQLLMPITLWWCIQKLESIRSVRRDIYRGLWTLLLMALTFQLLETHLRTRMKYMSPTGWLSEVILTQRDRDVWSWFHWDQKNRFSNLKQVQTAMRAYGIRREDRIISVPDPSPNITLSLLDQKGFTNLYDENMTGDERIEFYVQKGASYLVCNSMEWFEKRSESPWLQHPIIELEGMMVFDLLNSEAPLRDHARK